MRSAGASTSSIRLMSRRNIHATISRHNEGDDTFAKPGPPPLPMKEQREFEKLVRENANKPQFQPASQANDDKHPQYRAKPVPEFQGDTNPNTGEVGGPKNDPLKWEREWSYGGRATE